MTAEKQTPLPCQFCGSLVIVHCEYQMVCHRCGAHGPEADEKTEAAALEAWNRRFVAAKSLEVASKELPKTTEKQTPTEMAEEIKRLAEAYADEVTTGDGTHVSAGRIGDARGKMHAAVERLAALATAQQAYPLPDSLYPDSKDWQAADYAGRVEWLHSMYESAKWMVREYEGQAAAREPVATVVATERDTPYGEGVAWGIQPLPGFALESNVGTLLYAGAAPVAREPLSDGQIRAAAQKADCAWLAEEYYHSTRALIRVVETLHSIKPKDPT